MCNLVVSFAFHIPKKNLGVICDIFMEWCFDP
jgi:hypothetical protein